MKPPTCKKKHNITATAETTATTNLLKDCLAGVILALNPNTSPSIGRNNDGITPHFGSKLHDMLEDGILLDA
jgi:hypothetical protein